VGKAKEPSQKNWTRGNAGKMFFLKKLGVERNRKMKIEVRLKRNFSEE